MLEIEVTGDSALSEEDREACRRLYLDLKAGLDEGEVTPKQAEGIAANRGVVDVFRSLIVQGISVGAFGGLFEILKVWLGQRPTFEITLKYPDGSELKASKLSMEQALALHEQHSRALRSPPAS